jgi:uncharacterized membrane protein
MGERLRMLWSKLNTGYWLIPSLMALTAVGIAYCTVLVDVLMSNKQVNWWWLGYTGGPEGARAVLSAIASSMINVAGVVFSITVVILSLATQQFGTYILRSFMRDRGNQAVLGAFLSTFIYCIMVLRTVRGGEDGLQSSQFIPYVGVTLGLVFAMISLGYLIFFIHHLARSIKSSNLVARSGHDFLMAIDRLFPEEVAEPSSIDARPPPSQGKLVKAVDPGYLQGVDGEKLVQLGAEHDLLIVMRVRPGTFIGAGDELALLTSDPIREIKDELCCSVRSAFVLGNERTIDQDVSFGIETLVELGTRALSPGINNPVTATQCIDRLREGLYHLAVRPIPAAYRQDSKGVPRLYAESFNFVELLDLSIGRLIYEARKHPDVLIHLLTALHAVRKRAEKPSDQQALMRHVVRIERYFQTIDDDFFQEKFREVLQGRT